MKYCTRTLVAIYLSHSIHTDREAGEIVREKNTFCFMDVRKLMRLSWTYRTTQGRIICRIQKVCMKKMDCHKKGRRHTRWNNFHNQCLLLREFPNWSRHCSAATVLRSEKGCKNFRWGNALHLHIWRGRGSHSSSLRCTWRSACVRPEVGHGTLPGSCFRHWSHVCCNHYLTHGPVQRIRTCKT
jgi:hypothetical protein